MEPTAPIIHDRSDYLTVVFGNTTFLINPKIHFHSDNSMIIMDISGEDRLASSLLTLQVTVGNQKSLDEVNRSMIDISGQYIHSYHDISGQHIHTYPDISGLHIHPYMNNNGTYIHPYHDVSGWHIHHYRDVSCVANSSGDKVAYRVCKNLSRDIGWHIHPYDGSDNIIHDASGWHFKPPPIREITVLQVKTIDASLNWYYLHHGHPIDLSMTDISGIHPRSIHIHQYDYPYPSSTLFPNSSVSPPCHHNSVCEYFNEFMCDIHKIMLGDVTEIHLPEAFSPLPELDPTPFEFPIDFIPDVSIPSICTYTNVSTSIIDISGNEFIHIVDTITDISGNQTTCDISASVIDISGSEPILHIVDTITDISGNQTTGDISASVIDISGSEPIIHIDITDTSGNQSSYDISASNVERDTSGILQSSTYIIDCSSNSIHVTLSDFGNNLPPYVVYICDTCAKAKLSTP